MKKIFIALMFSFGFLSSCNPKDQPLDKVVNLQNAGGIPIAKVKINGKEIYVIMDTGASISVIDEKSSRSLGFNVFDDPESTGIAGYGGTNVMRLTDIHEIELDGYTINGDFKTQNLTNIITAIKNNTGFEITGIVGMNFMRTYDFAINFTNNTISFNP